MTVMEGAGTYRVDSGLTQTADIDLVLRPEGLVDGESITVSIRAVHAGTQPTFGMLPFITGTLVTTALALLLAIPLGLGCAVYLAEYCPKRVHRYLRPLTELLAGVPSVVYGLWGWFTVAPALGTSVYPLLGSDTQDGRNLLTAGLVLGIMILPFLIVLSESSIRAVRRDIKDSSLALGTSKWQTIRHVVLPAAKSGIGASIIVATGRAIGETMAVLMIMGVNPRMPDSVFDSAGTMTSVIALFYGEVLTLDLSRHAVFALATVLFFMVFALNVGILRLQRGGRRAPADAPAGRVGRMKARVVGRIPKVRLPGRAGPRPLVADESAPSAPPDLKNLPFAGSTGIIRKDEVMRGAVLASTAVVVLALVAVLFDVMSRGGTSLTLDYLLTEEKDAGLAGGFANAVTGSLALVGGALLVAAPLAVLSAIYIREYKGSQGPIVNVVLFASDTLASTPSIVFGAFGFAFFVIFLNFKFSLLAGFLTLALMILPILLRSALEALDTVPVSQREAAYALGATRWQVVRGAVLPSAAPMVSSGVILGIGRAIGETAVILLTAGYSAHIVSSVLTPAASMPVLIYDFFERSIVFPVLKEKVYSAAALLILIVLVLNFLARLIEARAGKIKGSRGSLWSRMVAPRKQ
jgi:phosphate transport system permease protein